MQTRSCPGRMARAVLCAVRGARTPGIAALLLALVPANAYAQVTPSEQERNPARLVLAREHVDAFQGGRTIEVSVQIAATDWSGITALGLYEKVPSGWTVVDTRALAGPAPAVGPEAGASGVLQFLWITPPSTPVTLQYTLRIPPPDHGVKTFSGQLEYRLDGGKLTSNVALTSIDGVADQIPVITLRGSAMMTLAQDDVYTDPGATARDPEDGDLSARIQTAGRVEMSRTGQYRIVYGVTDSVGNRAMPVTRVVTVQAPAGSGQPGTAPGSPAPGGIQGPRRRAPRESISDREQAKPGGLNPGPRIANPGVLLGEKGPEYPLPLTDSPDGAGSPGARTGMEETVFPVREGAQTPSVQDAASAQRPTGSAGALGMPPTAGPPLSGYLVLAAAGILTAILITGWGMAWGRGARRGRR
jgi:hypothetical protein